MTDPRNIERINPQSPVTDTNVNTPVDSTDDANAPRIQGTVVTPKTPEPSDKQVFPGKGRGENKKAGGPDAA